MKRPKIITNEQANGLGYWLEGRYKILFELAVESGLRISDLLKLKGRDIKQNPMTVYETKSRRKRTVKISDELFRRLDSFRYMLPDNAYVFHSERDSTKHVHRSTIHRQIKKALKWLDFDASAHSARKLYAKNIFEESGSVEKVQRAMNHQKLSTTLLYLENPQQNGEETLKNATRQPTLWQKTKNIIKKIFRR